MDSHDSLRRQCHQRLTRLHFQPRECAWSCCSGESWSSSLAGHIFTQCTERSLRIPHVPLRLRCYILQLLYSKYSQSCVINPSYADPQNFDQVMDIFTVMSSTVTQYVLFLVILICHETICSSFDISGCTGGYRIRLPTRSPTRLS